MQNHKIETIKAKLAIFEKLVGNMMIHASLLQLESYSFALRYIKNPFDLIRACLCVSEGE